MMNFRAENAERILIVEDSEDTRRMLLLGLSAYGYEVETAADGETAKKLLKKPDYAVVVVDLKLPDVPGLELISQIKRFSPSSQLVVMTAHASVQVAQRCVKEGAAAFIVKPFTLEQMHYTLQTALMEKKLLLEEKNRYNHILSESSFGGMVGRSMEIKKIYHLIVTVARTDTPVVISGETGTGKELVARAIHGHSERSGKKMVVINCASLSEHLLESELFGHVKGAFTGALKDKPGLLKVASESTVLLDEVSEINRPVQARLLRFLQNGEFRPVGGTASETSHARILATTNVKLDKRVESGRFREDLYHRLNVITIFVPPLRERREDIPLLSHHFLRIFAARQKKQIKTISPSVLSALMARDWPGNVRELENAIERAVTFCGGDTISSLDLPPDPGAEVTAAPNERPLALEKAVRAAERDQVIKALRASGGNKTRAAKLLGIDRITLWRKIKAHGLTKLS